MDVKLPGMGGIDAVGKSWAPGRCPSSYYPARSARTRPAGGRAGRRGARRARQGRPRPAAIRPARREPPLRHRIKVLSRGRVIRHLSARARWPSAGPVPGRRASVIGICASVGGPQVLMGLLDALPADYPIPILVVQHIAAGFTDGLVHWLDQAVGLPVGIAAPGTPAGAGVWFAPEGGAPHARCLRATGPRPAYRRRTSSPVRRRPAHQHRGGGREGGCRGRAERDGQRRRGRRGGGARPGWAGYRAGPAVLGGIRDAEVPQSTWASRSCSRRRRSSPACWGWATSPPR